MSPGRHRWHGGIDLNIPDDGLPCNPPPQPTTRPPKCQASASVYNSDHDRAWKPAKHEGTERRSVRVRLIGWIRRRLPDTIHHFICEKEANPHAHNPDEQEGDTPQPGSVPCGKDRARDAGEIPDARKRVKRGIVGTAVITDQCGQKAEESGDPDHEGEPHSNERVQPARLRCASTLQCCTYEITSFITPTKPVRQTAQ